MSVGKYFYPIFAIFGKKNISPLFENRFRRARLDQNHMKFVVHKKSVFEVYYALNDFLPNFKKSNNRWYKIWSKIESLVDF